jgi:hypothetical protein
MREYRLTTRELRALGPARIAQAVDARWIREWPLTLTERGRICFNRQGWGDALDLDAPGERGPPRLTRDAVMVQDWEAEDVAKAVEFGAS